MNRSEGARLLAAVDMTREQLARRVGVGKTTVIMWISGERVPNEAHRESLRAAFGIPIDAWPTEEWKLVCDVIVRKLAQKAPHLLREIVDELESVTSK